MWSVTTDDPDDILSFIPKLYAGFVTLRSVADRLV